MKSFTTLFICFLLLGTLVANAQSEDTSSESKQAKINNWSITLNAGAPLFWGDLSDNVSNPFSKYFSKEQGLGYGLILTRNINNVFSVNLEYFGGNLSGIRNTWSNGAVADLSFNAPFNDINLNVEVDLLNLIFEKKERRWFSTYLKGGVGYVFYQPTVTHISDGSAVFSGSGSTLEIPLGFGFRSDISKHLSLRLENTFHFIFVDDIDGYSSQFSKAHDIYTYTSLGITYRIYQEPKQPKTPKIQPIEPADTLLANQEPIEIEPAFELSIAANIPSSLRPYDTSDVTLRISKGNIEGAAKIQQTIPQGFEVKELLSGGGKFDFTNQIMSISWAELPEKEVIDITYRLTSNNASISEHSIPGIMFYRQDEVDQIRQFKKSIEIKPEAIIAEVNNNNDNNNNITESPIVSGTPAKTDSLNKGDLVYRVQVYAVYGGTTSANLLQKRLNLDYNVEQTYDGNYAKYTSGEFATYDEAAAYKKKLRSSTVPGAFVVGYYEGARINNIQKAISIEKGEQPSQLSSSNIPMGLIYRIQIAASSKNISVSELKNSKGVTDDVVQISHNGLYKYEIGNYTNYEEAKVKLAKIRTTVYDAFIVKYKDGKRI